MAHLGTPAFKPVLLIDDAVVADAALQRIGGGELEALGVALIFFVVQQFEANLIYPVVVKKVVGVPPLLVILALLIGFKLFGFLGVLLSVPLAGVVQEVVSDIDRRKTRALERKGLAADGDAL